MLTQLLDHRYSSYWAGVTVRSMGCTSYTSSYPYILTNILPQPFNEEYQWFNTTDNLIIPNATATFLNPYMGGAFQQATSGVTESSRFHSSACLSVV